MEQTSMAALDNVNYCLAVKNRLIKQPPKKAYCKSRVSVTDTLFFIRFELPCLV